MSVLSYTTSLIVILALPLKILINFKCRNLFPLLAFLCVTVVMLNGLVVLALVALYRLLFDRLFSSLLSMLTLGPILMYLLGS